MPEMDGYQATAKIRSESRFANLPIIAMTAHATIEEKQHCLAAGMNDHVSKPIDPSALTGPWADTSEKEAGTLKTPLRHQNSPGTGGTRPPDAPRCRLPQYRRRPSGAWAATPSSFTAS